MQKLLFITIVGGAVLGLALPSDPPKGGPVEAAAVTPNASGETQIEREDNGHFYVDAEVNGDGLVHFVVDTGASTVALTTADAERLGVDFSPGEFTIIGSGASGDVRGQMVTLGSVSIDGKEVLDVRGAVLEGLGTSLLGQSYLSRISGVEMSGDTMVLR